VDEQRYPDELNGPELLNIPPKLMQLLTEFNRFKIFIIEGGRGSSKTQTIARIIVYIMQMRVVRVICGREIQATIEESVYTVFLDIINKFTLAYHATKARIRSLTSGSTIGFKGFRERGAINIKGIEGADLVWVDEAQALTKPTIDALLPTLRKDTPVKFFFSLNRLLREDAIMELATRDDCLHIHIDYFENPFCPITLIDEAELCKNRSERDYNHIWLGLPVKAGDEYIFDSEALYASLKTTPYGDLFFKQKVLGIDWAAQGSDKCVATLLERGSAVHWRLAAQIQWDEPNTSISVGRIIKMIAEHKPDVVIIDIGGGGYNVYCDLITAGHKNVFQFDGGSTKGVNSQRNINMRADGYFNLYDWFEQQWLCIGEGYKDTLKQLERIKRKFRPDGRNQVREKLEYKQEHGQSPDEADSLMMAVYGIRYLGKTDKGVGASGQTITRKSGMRRTRI
jgi:phage terminase large subunit